jgi:hypothetical protein
MSLTANLEWYNGPSIVKPAYLSGDRVVFIESDVSTTGTFEGDSDEERGLHGVFVTESGGVYPVENGELIVDIDERKYA